MLTSFLNDTFTFHIHININQYFPPSWILSYFANFMILFLYLKPLSGLQNHQLNWNKLKLPPVELKCMLFLLLDSVALFSNILFGLICVLLRTLCFCCRRVSFQTTTQTFKRLSMLLGFLGWTVWAEGRSAVFTAGPFCFVSDQMISSEISLCICPSVVLSSHCTVVKQQQIERRVHLLQRGGERPRGHRNGEVDQIRSEPNEGEGL